MSHRIDYAVVPSATLAPLSPAAVRRRFAELLDAGAVLAPVGAARRRPATLLARGYWPRFACALFDAVFFLTGPRQNDDIRFLVAYVGLGGSAGPPRLHPRIFYKDISLTWRAASHWIRSDHENWIGKGDVKVVREGGYEHVHSDELTTDLPLELQTALESACRSLQRVPRDEDAVRLVLQRAPAHRIEPYAEFSAPRRRAARDPRNRVNGGRPIARFLRPDDPGSLRFVRGYEPDFARGVLEIAAGTSRIYGGALERFRIVSTNRRVQYSFVAAPKLAWIASCQATSTELSSFGVRTVDAHVPDELLVPGYEYHFVDDTTEPPSLHSQVPEGFAGAASEVDPARVDTSAWLDAMPVIEDFRRFLRARTRATRKRSSA